MKIFLPALFMLFFATVSFAQNVQNNPNQETFLQNYRLEEITKQLTNISKSVDELNKRLGTFSETFSSNQGIKFTERQQKLLVAFEFLNRAEQRLAALQNLKLTLTEKQTSIRLQLARITDDAQPESIDRYVALRGTTNAEQFREIRRQALLKEKNALSNTAYQIQNDLSDTEEEIRQTISFLKTIRQRIFPEIEKELSNL